MALMRRLFLSATWLAWLLLFVGLATPVVAQPTAQTPAPSNTQALTLADLEQAAVNANPTLAQAAAQVEAARGRTLQSGLYPNPTVGYQGDEIGVNGTAGFQGVFIDQLIITGGKLRLNRARFQQEVCQ